MIVEFFPYQDGYMMRCDDVEQRVEKANWAEITTIIVHYVRLLLEGQLGSNSQVITHRFPKHPQIVPGTVS